MNLHKLTGNVVPGCAGWRSNGAMWIGSPQRFQATAFIQLDSGKALWQDPSGARMQAGCRPDLQGRNGAGDETRTRDSLLGRQALYQLSYPRKGVFDIISLRRTPVASTG